MIMESMNTPFGNNTNMMMSGMNGPQNEMFGGPEMNWMGMMGMPPPGMNPAAVAMMRMRMNAPNGPDQWGFGMGSDMMSEMGRPPFMNPGFPSFGPDEMWNGMNNPFPGMPPQDMFHFGGPNMHFNPRGGFNGRGRGRGGRHFSNQGLRRRSDNMNGPSDHGSDTGMRGNRSNDHDSNDDHHQTIKGVAMVTSDEEIPTGPRAERDNKRAPSPRFSRRRSRSPSSRRESKSRKRSPTRSRSPQRSEESKRESRSRKRTPSRSPSPQRSDHNSSKATATASPSRSHKDRPSSSSRHRSSRHHTSRYRSRDRERDRDRDRGRDRERERDRDKYRERSQERGRRRERR
ncbi:hypothetical protein CLU79DRAFT_432464 [Phycomyces nitens]|nr:hypothetical protein CLU79DRAFT_432464 [Phycomyces nitens]